MLLSAEKQSQGWMYQCDECKVEFFVRQKKNIAQQFHFHNKTCMNFSMKHGVLRTQAKKTSLERYGTLHPTQSYRVKQKMCDTNLERYGVPYATSAMKIRAKMSKTAVNTFQKRGEEIQQRRRATNFVRRGVDYPMSDPNVRAKSIETCNVRYGCDNVAQNDNIQHQIQVTCLERYGVTSVLQRSDVRASSASREASLKRHETMKRNGSYRKSNPEDRLYVLLCDKFGNDDVQRQVIVLDTCWPIDFYVKSIDTYIQLDGVYWHGLDRPIEVIAEHRTPRDEQIHKKWLTDRKQDVWFTEHGFRLVRVTDQQLLSIASWSHYIQ